MRWEINEPVDEPGQHLKDEIEQDRSIRCYYRFDGGTGDLASAPGRRLFL
jgi:hypothetical protein